MSIIVDNREHNIIGELAKLGICHSIEQLDIGDFHIKINNKIVAIWERKTYSDLASSIKDSRYLEQKHRLLASDVPIKGYILEGSYPNIHAKFQGLHEGTIDSIVMGLTVRDGFKLLYSTGLEHTAKILAKMLNKFPEYDKQINVDDQYRSVVVKSRISTIKKENYTPEMCYISQIAQIPQMSYLSASAIVKHYSNMKTLLSLLETPSGITELSKIMINNKRLGQIAANRVKMYLLGETTAEADTVPVLIKIIPKIKKIIAP